MNSSIICLYGYSLRIECEQFRDEDPTMISSTSPNTNSETTNTLSTTASLSPPLHLKPNLDSDKHGKSKNTNTFKCNICMKIFNRVYNLKAHMMKHNDIKPFSCKFCGKCFIQKYAMINHTYTHTGQSPHTCADCGKSFCQRSNLLTHCKRQCHKPLKPH